MAEPKTTKKPGKPKDPKAPKADKMIDDGQNSKMTDDKPDLPEQSDDEPDPEPEPQVIKKVKLVLTKCVGILPIGSIIRVTPEKAEEYLNQNKARRAK